MMVDCHTHILPRMDDGSRSSDESIQMLRMERDQGVDTVILTPHFYADRESTEKFLERRAACFARLRERTEQIAADGEELPDMFLGAEVRYFAGMSQFDGIDKLCIGDTRYMLVEMPFDTWSDGVFRDLEILQSSGIKPVIAHIERFIKFQKHTDNMDRLWSKGWLIQSNASFFTDRWTAGKAIKLLKQNKIHLLGSDSHRAEGDRTPDTADALVVIQKKLGPEAVQKIKENGYKILE